MTQMPEVIFHLWETGDKDLARLYVTQRQSGVEVVIEGLPVEIVLPSTLLGPLPESPLASPPETPPLSSEPVAPDDLRAVLRDTSDGSSIFVRAKVRMTEEMDFVFEPAVVISIGPCRFVGLPCRGLHDLNLVPSPTLQGTEHTSREQALEWIRNPIDSRSGDATHTGVVTARTLDLDNTQPPLKELVAKLNGGRSSDTVEFVVEDIAIPLYSLSFLPVPTHGLFGLRRQVEDTLDLQENFDVSDAPAQVAFGDWRVIFEQLIFSTYAQPLLQIAVMHEPDIVTNLAADVQKSDTLVPVDDTSVFPLPPPPFTVVIGRNGDYAGEVVKVTGFTPPNYLDLSPSVLKNDHKASITAGGTTVKTLVRLTSWAITAGITDEWTIQLGARQSGLHSFTFFHIEFIPIGAKVGWSIKRYRSRDPIYKIWDQMQLLVDFGVSIGATDKTFFGVFEIRTISGQATTFVFNDVGWNLGQVQLLPSGASLPEGIELVAFKKIILTIEDIGFVTENNGGRYFYFSGGIAYANGGGEADRDPSSGGDTAGSSEDKDQGNGVRFHRLRGRIGGNVSAPAWLLDGISLSLHIGRFAVTGFGNVREFKDADNNQYKEFALGLEAKFPLLNKNFDLGLLFVYGHREPSPTGAGGFTYWMFGLQFSPLPLGSYRLEQVRALYATNMVPDPPTVGEQNLRLFRWYQQSGSTVGPPPPPPPPAAPLGPPSRQLDSSGWKREDHSFAAALGFTLTTSFGQIARLDLFGLFMKSPKDSGLLIAVEAFLAKSDKPVGYGALDIDFDSGKWGFTLGVVMTPANLLPDLPMSGVLAKMGSLSGTLYVGNQPATLAIGQLSDQSTWLTLRFPGAGAVFTETSFVAAFCLQLVDEGPKAVALALRIAGRIGIGNFGALEAYANLQVTIGCWRNESRETGFRIDFQAGMRIVLFWVFELGVGVDAEYEMLGINQFNRLVLNFSVDTPWWWPSVSYRYDKVWGESHPELTNTLSTPLTGSGALSPDRSYFDLSPGITPLPLPGSPPLNDRDIFNLQQLEGLPEPSLADKDIQALTPVGVDATIALDFKPSVDAQVTVVEATPSGAGTQQSNDLNATYELVELSISRRPRFMSGGWTDLTAPTATTSLETPEAIPWEDDAALGAVFAMLVPFIWDQDQSRDGNVDPRRLLINSETPYNFLSFNPEIDEDRARNNPGWPCCPDGGARPIWHELDFSVVALGARAPSQQLFSQSSSMLHWIGPRPPVVASQATSPGTHAARLHLTEWPDGTFAAISFDKPVSVFELDVDWATFAAATGAPGPSASVGASAAAVAQNGPSLVIEIYDGLQLLDRRVLRFALAPPLPSLTFPPPKTPPARLPYYPPSGITSVLLRFSDLATVPPSDPPPWMEIISARYRTLRDDIDQVVGMEKCKALQKRALTGGRVAWLPNHDYRIGITAKATVGYAAVGAQAVYVRQKSYFRTKGLTGLNAVKRTGEELEPYVESRYPGPAPRTLYRSQPLALAFNERFNNLIAVPVGSGVPSGDPPELSKPLEWVLAVEMVGSASDSERVSLTAGDWIVAHRATPLPASDGSVGPQVIGINKANPIVRPIVRQAATLDSFRRRFDNMLQVHTGCKLTPPALHSSQVLFHDPVDPNAAASSSSLWQADKVFRANVRLSGAPFVERNPFEDADLLAFDFADEGTAASNPWAISRGVMTGSAFADIFHYAVFGDTDWADVQVHASLDPKNGSAGVAFGVSGVVRGVAGQSVTAAVMALIDNTTSTPTLRLRRFPIDFDTSLGTSKQLPLGSRGPFALEVIAFDDILQARVGDTYVEVARQAADDLWEGRMALVEQEGGLFNSIVVEGLDSYRFYFATSRYVSFNEHVISFSGKSPALPVGTAGPVSTTTPMLFATTSSQFSTLMTPSSDREVRQRLFDKWLNALGLPVRTQPQRLELNRVTSAAYTEFLLLESPEPLPFSEDVTVTLSQRILATFTAGDIGKWTAQLSFADLNMAGPMLPGGVAANYAATRWLVRAMPVSGTTEYHVFDLGTPPPVQAANLPFLAPLVQKVSAVDASTNPITKGLTGMTASQIALVTATGAAVIVPFDRTTEKYQAIATSVLTNGSETHALIIPIYGPLLAGTYRLDFQLNRVRYRSDSSGTSSTDSGPIYSDSGSILLQWT
jgi:hypothetical protein